MEIEASKVKRQVNKSNLELLQQLKIADTEEDVRILIEQLYFRLAPSFYKICKIVASRMGYDENVADELFQTVFITKLYKLNKFEYEDADDDETLRKRILAWFGKSANFWLRDYKENNTKFEPLDELIHDPGENDIYTDDEYSDDITAEEIQEYKLKEVILSLSQRERDIFDMCALHDCIDNGRHLPDKVLDDLCNQLQISKAYFRQLKKRLLEKIYTKLKQ